VVVERFLILVYIYDVSYYKTKGRNVMRREENLSVFERLGQNKNEMRGLVDGR